MGTGCPLRWARRRMAATGNGDTFVQDETDADHFFSFWYEGRGRGKAGTRAGGGRRGKMGTGCPLRRARRRTAATGDGDTFVQDETDADHFFFSE